MPRKLNPKNDKTTIAISKKTRRLLLDFGSKDQNYDQIINELLKTRGEVKMIKTKGL